jgi:hypothetical protein
MLILKRALLGDEAAPASLFFSMSAAWSGGADILFDIMYNPSYFCSFGD